MAELNNEESDVEDLDSKKREFILGTRVSHEFLQLIDQAVAKGDYKNRTEFIRHAAELYARHLLEPGQGLEQPDTLSEKEQEYKVSVETTIDLIKDFQKNLADATFEDEEELVKEFAEEVKRKGLRKTITLWYDDRIRKAMRRALRDEIYPTAFFDGKRRFRKKKAREWVEILRKELRIPRLAAQELVEDPDLQNLKPYQEWI